MSNENRPDRRGPDGAPPRLPFNNRIALVTLLALVLIFVLFYLYRDGSTSQPLPYSVFSTYLDGGQVEAVKIVDQYEIQGTLRSPGGDLTSFRTTIPYPDERLMERLLAQGVRVSGGRNSQMIAQRTMPKIRFIGVIGGLADIGGEC